MQEVCPPHWQAYSRALTYKHDNTTINAHTEQPSTHSSIEGEDERRRVDPWPRVGSLTLRYLSRALTTEPPGSRDRLVKFSMDKDWSSHLTQENIRETLMKTAGQEQDTLLLGRLHPYIKTYREEQDLQGGTGPTGRQYLMTTLLWNSIPEELRHSHSRRNLFKGLIAWKCHFMRVLNINMSSPSLPMVPK